MTTRRSPRRFVEPIPCNQRLSSYMFIINIVIVDLTIVDVFESKVFLVPRDDLAIYNEIADICEF